MPLKDYEDAVQVAAAQSQQLAAIVTRDLSNYQNSPLLVYSPADSIALIS